MKLKFIILLTLLLSSGLSLAQNQGLNQCEKEGEEFGNGLGHDQISFECYEFFRKAAHTEAIKKSSNQKTLVFGHRNIVFIKQGEKVNIIAGKYTELDEILAIAIDENHQEIAVLIKNGDVLFFSSALTGNVAPLRILKNKELDGSTDLVVNGKTDEVIIFNKTHSRLLFFSRLANFSAPENRKKLNLLRTVRINPGQSSLSLDQDHQELFLLDSTKMSVQVHSLDNLVKDSPRLRLDINISDLKAPAKLEYSSVKDSIVISNGVGDQIFLSRLTGIKTN
jgi:hypothetical protein